MSGRVDRDENGKFVPGQSGNPQGARLRQPKALLTVDDLQRIQLEVAGEIVGHRDGKPVTSYENAVRSLARPNSSNRLAARDHIELTKIAAYHFEQREQVEARRKRGY
jgi:hypothetical protein